MTTFVFANFFQTTIAAAATSSQTTISVASNAGVPTIAAGQQWAIVVQSASTPSIREVMCVTATSGTTFTVARGQEGTAAQAWSVGDNVTGANTAGQMGDMVQSPHMTDGSISPSFGTTDVTSLVSTGPVSGTTGTFSGEVSTSNLASSGPVSGTTATFSGAASAASAALTSGARGSGDNSRVPILGDWIFATASLGTLELPNSAFVQWGQTITSASGPVTLAFYTAFPNGVLAAAVSFVYGTTPGAITAQWNGLSKSGIAVIAVDSSGSYVSVDVSAIAIGY